MRIRCVLLTALMFGMCWVALGQYVSPTDSATRIHRVAPTTRPWYEPDDSLVSMTFLAETVVKRVPAEQRRAWYNDSRRLSFKPAIDAQYIDRPSREALRFAHFLFTVKQIESDPECLRAIGNPVDPKRECQQERKDKK